MTLIACLFVGVSAGVVRAEKVVEKYDDGKTKVEYVTDADGTKNGPFREFYPTGRPARQGRYVGGKLHGPVTEFDENGRKSGEQVWAEGVLLVPRGRQEMAAAMRAIATSRIEGPGTPAMRESVKQLMMYRYLCGAPYEGIVLDEDLSKRAAAAALTCDKLGQMTHHPDHNPGLPDETYRLALDGCSQSNLAYGTATRGFGVDAYMDDSDERNIDRVGHRRWCLNPRLRRVGFGESGKFAAMYAHDETRGDVPDWDMITYPARGYMPTQLFGAERAWSVTLNPQHYATPSQSDIKVRVWEVRTPALDVEKLMQGAPLNLDYFAVELQRFGVDNCIIFRPEHLTPRMRQKFFVEIEGVKTTSGDAVTVRYYVEFI